MRDFITGLIEGLRDNITPGFIITILAFAFVGLIGMLMLQAMFASLPAVPYV